jgi:hypothetical protein
MSVLKRAVKHHNMWDTDPRMYAYATGPDLDALIAQPHGDPAPIHHQLYEACLPTAGCPSAERNLRTQPTGAASPVLTPVGVDSSFAQPHQPGRADTLKRRRKVRDEILGRERQLSQSPSRKGWGQTLNRCWVQPACEVDARFGMIRLQPFAERQAPHAVKN